MVSVQKRATSFAVPLAFTTSYCHKCKSGEKRLSRNLRNTRLTIDIYAPKKRLKLARNYIIILVKNRLKLFARMFSLLFLRRNNGGGGVPETRPRRPNKIIVGRVVKTKQSRKTRKGQRRNGFLYGFCTPTKTRFFVINTFFADKRQGRAIFVRRPPFFSYESTNVVPFPRENGVILFAKERPARERFPPAGV